MGYPSFNTGDVLAAADMNAVGLWLIKTQTVGTAVSTVTVSDAFSSTYENYRIIYSGGVGSSTDSNISLQLGSSTASYDEALIYNTFANATVNGFQRQNQTSWVWTGNANNQHSVLNIDLFGPNLTKYTYYKSNGFSVILTNAVSGGVHKVATAYTAFTLAPQAGTMTGGTIRVYGYRN